MDISNEVEFYCLNYQNQERKDSMLQRFQTLDISCNFYDGVCSDDIRLKDIIPFQGSYSSMYGHLDMIHHFYYQTNKPFGIFCEDDILIHKDFKKYLTQIIKDFLIVQWDVLLLGYLITINIRENYYNGFDLKKFDELYSEDFPYQYYQYPDDVWGAQMYMLSRVNAKKILDKYYVGYLEKKLQDDTLTPFSCDWTITKDGNRMLLYPLLAIEDGKKNHDHSGQNWHHYYSYFNNYREGEFV